MAFRTELRLRLANSPGALAALCRVLGDERVDITAMMLESNGQLRLLVDNPVRAAAVLNERRYHITQHDVLTTTVPDRPGAIAHVLALLANAGVNLDYLYSGAGAQRDVTVVLGLQDPVRVATAAGL